MFTHSKKSNTSETSAPNSNAQRSVPGPTSNSDDLLQLQSTMGNRYVAQLLRSRHNQQGNGSSVIQRNGEGGEKQGSSSKTGAKGNTGASGTSSGSSGASSASTTTASTDSKPKASPVTFEQGHEAARTGDDIDRIIHEIAVRITQIFDEEVPLDQSGVNVEKLKGAPVEKETVSKRKQKAALKEAAKSSKAKQKETAPVEHAAEEEDVLTKARKNIKGQKLNALLTQVLIELRQLTRLYQMAYTQSSDHGRGRNIFHYQGIDFIVNHQKYVAPVTSTMVKGKDNIVPVEDSFFNDHQYPDQEVSAATFREIIMAIVEGRPPEVSSEELTLFIAAVAAEYTRYQPQIVSVLLALSGISEDIDKQRSIFTSGLTMTTGSTDPGSGSHVDSRPGFRDQAAESPYRATDVAAIREGGILRAAFTHPELGENVEQEIRARVLKGEDRNAIINEMALKLIHLMNKVSHKKAVKAAESGSHGTKSHKISAYLTPEMIVKHFPSSYDMPERSVENSTIVVLSPQDEQHLASELSRHDWSRQFRSEKVYDVVLKSSKGYVQGKAHIRLSDKGTESRKGNHWEGQDWVGETKEMNGKQFNEWKSQKTVEKQQQLEYSKQVGSLTDRVKAILSALKIEDKTELQKTSVALQKILDQLNSSDEEVRRTAQAQLVELEKSLSGKLKEKQKLQEIIDEYMPSNEWGLMPPTWQRRNASGLGHNCLIDSLLQQTTNLGEAERLREAAAIRNQLILEGRTSAMEFLYADIHAVRILQLIGADPGQYEIRTEWTHNGIRQINEVVGRGNRHVIRLWNTGVHYEPIAVTADDALYDELEDNQTNAAALRAGRPAWMEAALTHVGEEELGKEEAEAERKGKADEEREKAGYIKQNIGGWQVWSNPLVSKGEKYVLINNNLDAGTAASSNVEDLTLAKILELLKLTDSDLVTVRIMIKGNKYTVKKSASTYELTLIPKKQN